MTKETWRDNAVSPAAAVCPCIRVSIRKTTFYGILQCAQMSLDAVLRPSLQQLTHELAAATAYGHHKYFITLLNKGRNHTGPPCSVTVAWCHRLACMAQAACRPATECYRPQQTTTTDASKQKNTGPLGGPVITIIKAAHFSQPEMKKSQAVCGM